MSINAIDYSKSLAEEKEKYRRGLREVSANSKAERAKMEASNEIRDKKNAENYGQYKRNLEDSFQKRIGEIRDKTEETIDKVNSAIPKRIQEIQNKFQDEAANQKEDFRRKIEGITDSFRRANAYEKDEHAAIEKNNFENFSDKLNSQREQNSNQLNFTRELASKAAKENQEKRITEYADLSKDFQNSINDLQKNETSKRLDQVRNAQNQTKILKDQFESEKNIISGRHDDILKTVKKKNEVITENMQKNFEDLGKQFQERNARNERVTKDEYQNNINKIQDGYLFEKNALNKDIEELRSRKNIEAINGLRPKNTESIKDEFSKTLEEIDSKFDKKASGIRESYANDIDRVRKSSINREKKSLKDLSDYLTQTMADKGEENRKAINLYRKKDHDLIEHNDKVVTELEDKNSKRIKTNSDKFNRDIENIYRRDQIASEKLKEHYNDRQKGIILKNQQELSEIVEHIRGDLSDKELKTKNNLNEKLQNKDREMALTIEAYENKITEMDEQRAKDIRYAGMVYDEKHKQDMLMMKEVLEDREQAFDSKMKELKKSYETRIDDIIRQQGIQTRKVIGGFKEEIQNLNLENFQKLKSVEKLALKDRLEMKNSYDAHLNATISSYEDRLARMKNVHEDELTKAKTRSKTI